MPIDLFEVAILDVFFPTFGAATTPKNGMFCFFFLEPGDERGYEWKEKESEKSGTGPFLLPVFFPFLTAQCK